jgi:hypothetical protein
METIAQTLSREALIALAIELAVELTESRDSV